MTSFNPNSDPAVQVAYDAYTSAWVDVANLPGPSERSAAEAAAAHDVEYRLYEADKAHHDAWHAVNRKAHPELYRDGAVPVMTPDDWRDKYPLLNFGPMPHDAEPELETESEL